MTLYYTVVVKRVSGGVPFSVVDIPKLSYSQITSCATSPMVNTVLCCMENWGGFGICARPSGLSYICVNEMR